LETVAESQNAEQNEKAEENLAIDNELNKEETT